VNPCDGKACGVDRVRTGGAHWSRFGPPAFAGGTHVAMNAADHERERSRG